MEKMEKFTHIFKSEPNCCTHLGKKICRASKFKKNELPQKNLNFLQFTTIYRIFPNFHTKTEKIPCYPQPHFIY